MLELSQRALRISQAEIRAMSLACEKVGGVNLAQGVCDTEVPLPVRQGAIRAIENECNSYARCDGIAELRRAVAAKLRHYNGIVADPESEIVISAGSTGSFYCACLALLNPGDEVVLFEPYYGYHLNTLLAVEAEPVYVTLQAPDWSFTRQDLERAITPRTKAIVVNTPANPSGKVFRRDELEWISDCACRHDLFVFTDEIYEYFVYDGRKHISPATLPGMAERTVTISGYSKTFSITGWRIGYSVAHARWSQMIAYINDLVYVCAPTPLQHGVVAGIEQVGDDFYRGLLPDYTRRRDLICGALQHAGLTPAVPGGAYYVLADAARLPGRSSKEKAMHLLDSTGVASVPGASFFHESQGENLLRFCFAKTDRDLEEACRRLERMQSKVITAV